MSNLRHAAQRDANEPEIVAALEAVGASVTRLNGRGIPDLLVGFRGSSFLLEVKMPAGMRSGKRRGAAGLTEDQLDWWAGWRGESAAIVYGAKDALHAIGAIEPISGPEVLEKGADVPSEK